MRGKVAAANGSAASSIAAVHCWQAEAHLTSIANSKLIQMVDFQHAHDGSAADIGMCIPQPLLDWRHLHAECNASAHARLYHSSDKGHNTTTCCSCIGTHVFLVTFIPKQHI